MRMPVARLRLAAKLLASSVLWFATATAQAVTPTVSVSSSLYAPNGLLAPSGGTVIAGLTSTGVITPRQTTTAVSSLELRQVVGSSYSVLSDFTCTLTYEPGSKTPDDNPCTASLTAPLAVGSHELYVHAFTTGSPPGIDSAHVIVTVTSNSAPTVSISSPANGARVETTSGSASFTLAASGADVDGNLSSVSASIDGAAASLTGSSSISSPINLAVGHHTITVTAKDALGATGTSSIGVDVLADAAPAATLQSPANGSKFLISGSSTTITVQGTGSDPDAAGSGGEFDHLSLTVDGAANATSTTTSLNTSVTLAPGSHTIVLTATDKMGLTSSSTSNITITGNSAPTVSISSPANGARVETTSGSASFTLAASGADVDGNLSSVSASIDGAAASLTGSSSINSPINLAVGHHTITVTATDALGATGTSSIGLDVLADAAPTATLQSPANGSKFLISGSSTTITVQGVGSDPDAAGSGGEFDHLSLTVDGAANATSTTTSLNASVTLPPGSHTIVLTATDKMGLTSSSTSNVTVTANSAPTVSISSPVNGARVETTSGSASFTLAASGADVDGNLSSVSASIDGAAASLTGASSINSPVNLAVGHHTITVTATDALGATGTSSIGVDVLADVAPTATLQSPANGTQLVISGSTATVSVQGTGSDPDAAGSGGEFDHLSLTVDGVANATSTTTSLSTSLTLGVGSHSIVLTATDKMGLTSSSTSNVSIAADSPPTATLQSPANGAQFFFGGSSATVAVQGTGSDPDAAGSGGEFDHLSLTVDGAANATSTTTALNTSLTLAVGAHTIVLTATDKMGRTSSATSNITVLTDHAPQGSITSPTSGQAYTVYAGASATINVAGTMTDPDATYGDSVVRTEVWLDGASAQSVTGGNVSTTISSAVAGSHTVKLHAFDMSNTAGDSPTVNISIATVGPMTGSVDGEYYDQTNALVLDGWACDKNVTTPVNVAIYAGGPIGTGTQVGTVTANLASEPAVATACGTTGTTYRWSFPLASLQASHAGQALYVYGISAQNGGAQTLLPNSGNSSIPAVWAPKPVTTSPPNLAGGIAGTIPGQAAVSSRGASQYSFSIPVPPGTAGMVPSLGMSYDSENPIDISGVGWSLNGITEITRCKRTLATDGVVHPVDLTAADAYCLNGERLILISGTDGATAEYRTEVESFQRVKSFGSNTAVGPDYWTVETRDGRIMTIGGVAQNATVTATKNLSGTTVAANWMWKLQQEQDQHGNYMSYTYEGGTTGENYPTCILYTGNTAAGLTPYNGVEFVYEARSDIFSGYVSDAPVIRPNRLKQIRTHIGVGSDCTGGSVAREWNFAYTYSPFSNRSLLQSVTDCNGDGSQCLPSTNFAWTQRDASKNTYQASTGSWSGTGVPVQSDPGANGAPYLPQDQFAKRAVVGDFSGDGRHAMLTNAAGSSSWTLCSGAGTTFNCTSLPGMPAVSSENFFAGDFDGDGRTDVLVWAGGQTWYLCLSLGTGFGCNQVTGLPTGINYINTPLAPLVGDFDGDGRDDILFGGNLCTSTGTGFTCKAYNTSAFGMFDTPSESPEEKTNPAAHIMGDFDGDGRIDILAYQTWSADENCTIKPANTCIYDSTDFWRYTFGPTGLVGESQGSTRTGAMFNPVVGDLNGDGVNDVMFKGKVVRHSATGTVLSTNYYMNTCFGGTICNGVSNQSTDFSQTVQSAGDYLQSGGIAAVYADASGYSVVPFNADGTQGTNTPMTWGAAPTCTAATSMLLHGIDLDGDGIPDTLCYTPNSLPSSTGTWTYALSGSNSFSDRLQSVTDGNGLSTRWTYVSGADPIVTSGPRGTYPTKNVSIRTPVVSKISVDADSSVTAGKTLDTLYSYSGMRSDNRGRGSLGFEFVTSTDVATGVVTTTQYSQVFPTIAATVAVTKVGGGVTLHSDVSFWSSFATQAGVLYPYVRTQVTTGQDLDSTWLPRTVMQVGSNTPGATDGIDAYGNLTTVTTTSTENNGAGDSYSVIHNCPVYENRAPSQWVLGLCDASSQTVSPVNPNPKLTGSAGVRQVSSTYDSFGALASTTSMPGTSLALTTSYRVDPNTGVPTSITKTWTDPLDGSVKSPTTTISYDSNWRFPVKVINALNQSETHAYDPATGVQTSLIDFNNLTTTWKVDAWGRKTEEDRPDGTFSTLTHRLCVDSCGSLATNVDVVQHWAPGPLQMLAPEETLYDSRGRKLLYRTWNDASTEADTTWSYGDNGDLLTQALPKYVTDSSTGTTTNSKIDILHRPTQVQRTNAQGNGVDTTNIAYSALTTTTTDANSHTRTELLNALGKMKKVTDNNGQSVTYAYDGFGDLLSTTDPASNVVTMVYDGMGHKTSMSDPDLGNWTYIVDAVGHTRQQTDAKKQVTTNTYDLLDRLIERLEPDLDSHWTFDSAANGVGELAEAYTWIAATSSKDYRHVFAYDSLSRPSSDTTTLDWDYTTLDTYDSFGHLATVTHRRSAVGAGNVGTNPTGTYAGSGQFGLPEIQYTLGYNSRGAVSVVMRGATTVWSLNKDDAAGRTTLATLGSGLMTATHYNAYTAFLDMIQTGPSNGAGGVNATIQSDNYDYDAVGSLLHRYWLPSSGAAQMSETFTYDALNRLSTSQVGGLDLKSFNYDALGNIKFKTNVGTYGYVGHPHLVSGITGTVAGLTNPVFSYDANGNTQFGLNRLYAWSAANLPVSVDQLSDGTQASATLRHEFLYGPERERTREIVRAMSGTTIGAVQRTIYSTDSIEKEIDAVAGTTKIRTYLPLGLGFTEEDFAGTAIAPTSVGTPAERYYHKDNLGSPVIVTDASQGVLERMAYDAWGRRRQSNGLEVDWQSLSAQSASNTLDHKGYTDQEQLDDLSLVHLNGRVYDPITARFTSPDPTIPDPYDLQSFNRASYVRNSPMDKVDPTGFSDACPADCVTETHVDSAIARHFVKGTTDGNGAGVPYSPENSTAVTLFVAAAAAANAVATKVNEGAAIATQTSSRAATGAANLGRSLAQRAAAAMGQADGAVVSGFEWIALRASVGAGLLLYSGGIDANEDAEMDANIAAQKAALANQKGNNADADLVLSSDYRQTALRAMGISKSEDDGLDVHHIVQKGDPGAAIARANLKAVGIDINDIENLAVVGRGDHQNFHTPAYRTAVNALTTAALPGGRPAMIAALDLIKTSLYVKGSFP